MSITETQHQELKKKFRNPDLNGKRAQKFAYMMSRFPKITETFILYEILALEESGVSVEIYPLLKESPRVVHPEVEKVMNRVHYHPFGSLPILMAQFYFLLQRPRVYFKTFWKMAYHTLTGGGVKFFLKVVSFFPKMVRFAYEMQQQGITHIHAHFATHPTIAAWVIHHLTDIPFSFTAHGSDIHVNEHQCMLKPSLEDASFSRTISLYNKAFMVDICGKHLRDKIRVVHCGIDPEIFSPRQDSGADGPFQIVCVGSFEEVKGHKYLIEACRLLKVKGVDFRCHLVGEGPLKRELDAQIQQAGLNELMIRHGAVPREKVARLLQSADVMTLPSVLTPRGDREGLPVALMEAMAVGLPVVSSRLSGIPELVGDQVTGILVEPRNAPGLAAAFEKLSLNPRLRRQMGSAGRKKVFQEFHLNKNTEELLQIFLEQC